MGKFRSYKARAAIVHDTTKDPIEWDKPVISDYIDDDDYRRNHIVRDIENVLFLKQDSDSKENSDE